MGTVNNEDKIESNEPTLTANPIFEVRNKLLLRLMSSSVITQLFYPKVADKLYKTVPKFLKLLRYQFSPFFYRKNLVQKLAFLEGVKFRTHLFIPTAKSYGCSFSSKLENIRQLTCELIGKSRETMQLLDSESSPYMHNYI